MNEKNYYTIKEISGKTQVPEHTIRYWESKFKLLRPLRLKSGHRRYTKRDIEILNDLKDLIFIKGYSLRGAKKVLFKKSAGVQGKINQIQSQQAIKFLEEIKKDLRDIIKNL